MLDRDPDTLLGVWGLLAWSRCREDFADLGEANTQELREQVKMWGKNYWIAETPGAEGARTMGIDRDNGLENSDYETLRHQALNLGPRFGETDAGGSSETLIEGGPSPRPSILTHRS